MDAAYDALHTVSLLVGIASGMVLIYGMLRGLVVFVSTEVASLRGGDATPARRDLRHSLGYYLMLSLQFLIAADIIQTMIEPNLQELAILGGIIAIRTAISFSLTWELQH